MTDKESLKFSKFERIVAGLVFGSFTLALFIVTYFDPQRAGFFPKCIFHELTGLACPSCGLTRAFHAVLNGRFLDALLYNALLPVYLAAIFYFYIKSFVVLVRGYGFGFNLGKASYFLIICFFVVNLIFAVLRNLPFHPFNLLYP